MPDIAVRVCLRARPLVSKEISDGCISCLQFKSKAQVVLGKDKAFTFDCAYSPETSQASLYQNSVAPMLKSLFEGYNVTVLAYGQTGSGKTYTMGTSYSNISNLNDEEVGVIPRAMKDLFDRIKEEKEFDIVVKVSFLEIYKEEIHDLLRPSVERVKDAVTIRENYNGDLKINGLIEEVVSSSEDVLNTLYKGSLARSTGSTAMNAHSSRSHAIFTLNIIRQSKVDSSNCTTSKFHLVDLAGSEKAERTNAQGERFKEGVNINKGLLSLGNVINALCDRLNHIPYRDSKLTRLLQDSLGGNSHTMMIACVSPADYNFEETLNTLRYADRARKIKNKPIVNHDSQSLEVMKLKQIIEELKRGKFPNTLADRKSSEDMESLLQRNKFLEGENEKLSSELQIAVDQTTGLCEKVLLAEMAQEKMKQSLQELDMQTNNAVTNMKNSDGSGDSKVQVKIMEALQNKISEIQDEQKISPQELLDCSTESESEKSIEYCDKNKNESMKMEHTLRQAELQKQLQALNDALSKKEELAEKMSKNDGQLGTMKLHYEHVLKEMEDEVGVLRQEKEELSAILRSAQTNANSNKLSEQRRKRLQELEGKISNLQKKIMDQSKMLRMKEQVEKKVGILSNDIQSMKRQRVKLMQQMRKDAQHFQKWKSTKEKEVTKLKQQDRKRQFKMVKMEQIHSKQQNVLKRKIEEAVNHNKRLQETLAKKKLITDEKNKKMTVGVEGFKEKMQSWLNQEIDIAAAKNEANHHLKNLMEDRRQLTQQLSDLQLKRENQPPSKIRRNSFESSDEESKTDISDEIEQIKMEISVRSEQIAEMQQKIVDCGQDENKKRWDNIHSMAESKCTMKYLFDRLVKGMFQNFLQNERDAEATLNYEAALENIKSLQNQVIMIKQEHEENVLQMEKEHEEKVLCLLQQLPTSIDPSLINDSSLLDRIKLQDDEISRLGFLHEEYVKISKDNEELKKKLVFSKTLNTSADNPAAKKPVKKNLKKNVSKSHMSYHEAKEIFDIEEDFSDVENTKEDPDWVLKTETTNKSKSFEGCRCVKSACKGRCVCKKAGKSCTIMCKCNLSMCKNQSFETSNLRDDDDSINNSNRLSKENNSSNMDSDNLDATFKIETDKRKILKSVSNTELQQLETKNPKKKPKKSTSQSKLRKLGEDIIPRGILDLRPDVVAKKGESTFFGSLN